MDASGVASMVAAFLSDCTDSDSDNFRHCSVAAAVAVR